MSLGLIPLGTRPLGLAPEQIASGVSGTGAATNAADTLSASGSTTVTGSLAKSNANDTVAASGTIGSAAVTGTLARSNASDTSTAAGTTTVTGSVARANTSDTAIASGVAGAVSGSANCVNANDTVQASSSDAQQVGMPMFFGGGAGNMREVRAFADLLSKAPTKTAKKRRIRELKEAALDLLPDDPEAVEAAQAIAQVVAKKEIQTFAQWRPVAALQPVVAKEVFDPSEEIRRMVEEWLQNEAIEAELEDEFDVELLLLD